VLKKWISSAFLINCEFSIFLNYLFRFGCNFTASFAIWGQKHAVWDGRAASAAHGHVPSVAVTAQLRPAADVAGRQPAAELAADLVRLPLGAVGLLGAGRDAGDDAAGHAAQHCGAHLVPAPHAAAATNVPAADAAAAPGAAPQESKTQRDLAAAADAGQSGQFRVLFKRCAIQMFFYNWFTFFCSTREIKMFNFLPKEAVNIKETMLVSKSVLW